MRAVVGAPVESGRSSRTRRAVTAGIGAAVVALAVAPLAGCGKDETDVANLKNEVGVVPGQFIARLAQAYRAQVDALEERVNGVVPGLTAQIGQRFSGDDDDVDSLGTRLADLLAVKIPGTGSDLINQQIFAELGKLTGDNGPYFDLVDADKYLGNSLYEPTSAGKDAKFDDQYYLEMIRWKEGVATVTDAQLQVAAPVVVAVLDTGVRATHEDLTDVMWQQSTGANAGAVGYDAVAGKVLSKSTSADKHGHGTHVAGIIGAVGGNGKGIHGVGYVPGRGGSASQSITEIMAIKALNDNGAATSEQISQGVKWAVDQHWAQKKAVTDRAKQRLILNMSLGGPFEARAYGAKKVNGKYDFQDDIFNYATSKGDVLIVVAAGNDSCGIGGACEIANTDFKEAYYYPCSYANVLCVAATTHQDKLAGFSNRRGSVGIAAPGYEILSTLPASDSDYGTYSGTSQATPVTTGVAAVVWSVYPDLKAADLKLVLQKSAGPVSKITAELSGGDGRLDLKAALAYAAKLAAAGKSPADLAPDAASLSSSPVTPAKNPDTTGLDPEAASPNAVGDSGPNDKGQGSGKGCAVVAAGSASRGGFNWASVVLLLAVPWIGFGVRRRR